PSPAPSVTQFPTQAQQTTYHALFFGWNALIAREMHELFTARFGVECRYPFLDRRVVELLIALPEEQRWRDGEWRFILRQAMKDQLPESLRQRLVKAEFSPPIDRELRDRQGPAVEQLLRQSSLASMGMVDPRRLLACLERYRKGQEKFLTGTIMLLVGLELWYRSALLTTSKETVCQ
ncbi:MAG: asparagine synthase-related protein, partial [bacterium]